MARFPVHGEKRVNPVATRKNTRYSCFPARRARTACSAPKQPTQTTLTWNVRSGPTARSTGRVCEIGLRRAASKTLYHRRNNDHRSANLLKQDNTVFQQE